MTNAPNERFQLHPFSVREIDPQAHRSTAEALLRFG